jgi:hypothetical protein
VLDLTGPQKGKCYRHDDTGLGRRAAGGRPVGAENACYLGVCAEEAIGSVPVLAVGGGFARGRPRDDFRLVGLKLIFLIVTRAVSVLGLSRREAW